MEFLSGVVGYPYIGENREWKRLTEKYWKKQLGEGAFLHRMKQLRLQNVLKQQALELDVVTVGDFTLYDRMLDLSVMFGLIPERYGWYGPDVELETYYAMARGADFVVASEMTKWFNTNYHYIVPEYEGQALELTHNYLLDHFQEAKEVSDRTPRVTLIGPYTFMKLTKGIEEKDEPLFILKLLPLYQQVIRQLAEAGAEWIQLEEPALGLSLAEEEVRLVEEIYTQLTDGLPQVKIMLTTYFEALSAYERLVSLPVAGIGLDFVNGYEENMASMRLHGFPNDKVLAIGIVNGRDVWRANLAEKAVQVQAILQLSGAQNVWLQSSCSLQHVPVTKKLETALFSELHQALSFADEKIHELTSIVAYLRDANWSGSRSLSESMLAIQELAQHPSRKKEHIGKELATLKPEDFKRSMGYRRRRKFQKAFLQLPEYPTTTIGSFPQSPEVKKMRVAWRKQEISTAQYEAFLKKETARWIRLQEKVGLDVLVHGEFERTDMVEYFGEKLSGFAFTKNGWVVSYGSRCVKPPIIYGDVEWQGPMTVKEVKDAQQLTDKPVKGMLTGPVTILNWSFVRNDMTGETVAKQIALALRKEVKALEIAGIYIIQVDEPALREGLPLREEKRQDYVRWSIEAFKLATSAVRDTTQIHTHMCYCEFNDFIGPIRALDADVISIETSRSHGELIEALKKEPYELGIGLGVYDIHSPRIPSVDEMTAILLDSAEVIKKEQFWVNPDCGLKTREEAETLAALKNMVAAAKKLREVVLL